MGTSGSVGRGGDYEGASAVRGAALARWKQRRAIPHLFCVVRHAERADNVWAYYHGLRWTQTDDFIRWPVDPPLSDGGLEATSEIAERVRGFAEESASAIHVVVTSPYLRCVQTAVAIARKLGRRTRLLVDCSLGEVYGPAVMGETEPTCPVRSREEILEHCRGVEVLPDVIGQWPTWPESLKDARWRYAERFLTYLKRSAIAQRNFTLVTHADCLGTALSLMPSQAGQVVESVETGGLFMARRGNFARARQRKGSARASRAGGRQSAASSFSAVVPAQAHGGADDGGGRASDTDADDDWLAQPGAAALKVDPWTLEPPEEQSQSSVAEASALLAPPKASEGWQVVTHNVAVGEKKVTSPGVRTTVSKRVQKLLKHSKFSQEQIEHLLGQMSDKSLGGNDTEAEQHLFTRGMVHSSTQCSFSTYLFGGSNAPSASDAATEPSSPLTPPRISSFREGVVDSLASSASKLAVLNATARRSRSGVRRSRKLCTPPVPGISSWDADLLRRDDTLQTRSASMVGREQLSQTSYSSILEERSPPAVVLVGGPGRSATPPKAAAQASEARAAPACSSLLKRRAFKQLTLG